MIVVHNTHRHNFERVTKNERKRKMLSFLDNCEIKWLATQKKFLRCRVQMFFLLLVVEEADS